MAVEPHVQTTCNMNFKLVNAIQMGVLDSEYSWMVEIIVRRSRTI